VLTTSATAVISSQGENALVIALAAFSMSVQPASCAGVTDGDGYAHPDWLASADWLKRHLSDPAVKVVALTSEADFIKGHIPGAAQIDWSDLKVTDTSSASTVRWRDAVEQKLTSLGIGTHDTVVVYDEGTLFAARLWWVLDYFGQKDKRILNGGLAAWTDAGGMVDHGVSTAKPAAVPYAAVPDPAALAALAHVKTDLGNSNVVLIDTRTKSEYLRGHIPGATNINYQKDALSTSPRFWKSASALRQLYLKAGTTPDKEIIPYCSTGVRSAVTYFTLRLIGYPHVRLYTGSWDEWRQHPNLPKTNGGQP
jgi:thiosulfate/3-mercaptopyruvate sulfurtransferase